MLPCQLRDGRSPEKSGKGGAQHSPLSCPPLPIPPTGHPRLIRINLGTPFLLPTATPPGSLRGLLQVFLTLVFVFFTLSNSRSLLAQKVWELCFSMEIQTCTSEPSNATVSSCPVLLLPGAVVSDTDACLTVMLSSQRRCRATHRLHSFRNAAAFCSESPPTESE